MWRLRDRPGPSGLLPGACGSASEGSPLYVLMAQKPHLPPSHILLQSLPPPVAAPPPWAGAGGWPEWSRTAPSGSGGSGQGQEVKVTAQHEHWWPRWAASPQPPALVSHLPGLDFPLKPPPWESAAAPLFPRLPGWHSPLCASPLLRPTFPAGELSHPALHRNARPSGHVAAQEGRLLALPAAGRSAGWTSTLYGLVGGSGGAKLPEFGFRRIQSQELQGHGESIQGATRSTLQRRSGWPRAALGAGKGSLSREGPTRPFSIFVNNQILVNYCYKEPEQEGR